MRSHTFKIIFSAVMGMLIMMHLTGCPLPPLCNPRADFRAEVTSGDAPLSVQFTDASASGPSPIRSWSWNFGDGGTSTEQNPVHLYTVPGTYNVSLTVTTARGEDTKLRVNFISNRSQG